MNPIQAADMAHRIADRAVVADIESEAVPHTDAQGLIWSDTSCMLDPREMCDDFVEMNTQALDYAQQRGLITRHPKFGHLVLITKKAQ
jgi:hypothetical protein